MSWGYGQTLLHIIRHQLYFLVSSSFIEARNSTQADARRKMQCIDLGIFMYMQSSIIQNEDKTKTIKYNKISINDLTKTSHDTTPSIHQWKQCWCFSEHRQCFSQMSFYAATKIFNGWVISFPSASDVEALRCHPVCWLAWSSRVSSSFWCSSAGTPCHVSWSAPAGTATVAG